MRIRLQVTALEDMGTSHTLGRSGKVSFKVPADGTIYDHQVFIHLPWAEFQGVAIGDLWEIQSVPNAVVSAGRSGNWVDRGVSAAEAAVDRVTEREERERV